MRMRILIWIVLFSFGCSNYTNSCADKINEGDLQGAIADCNKAIEVDPKDARAYRYRGHAKEDLGDLQGAIADYNKAIEVDPKDAYGYLWRGNAKEDLGDLQGACLDWSKAGELGMEDVYEVIKEKCNK